MSAFQNHAGINLTSSKMQIVEVNYSGEEFTLENVDEEYFNEYLDFNAKEPKIIASMQEAFNELLARKSLKSKSVSFTLSHEHFKSVMLPYDNSLIRNDLMEQFKWEFSMLYPKHPVNDMVLHVIKVEDYNKEDKYNAVILATYRKHLELIKFFCQQNNLELRFVDNAHIASDNIIALRNGGLSEGFCFSLFIAGNYISVTFRANNRLIYFNVIPVANAGEILPKVTEELTKNKYIKVSSDIINESYIAGENISESFIQKANDVLNLNFEKINPFEEISVRPEIFGKKMFSQKANSFTSAAGIAFRIA
ncbi:MAG: hypothetical protein WCJ01_08660 [Ignavibacteria bacterium]